MIKVRLKNMRKLATLVAFSALFALNFSPPAFGSLKIGAKCSIIGQVKTLQGNKVVCSLSGSKQVWKKFPTKSKSKSSADPMPQVIPNTVSPQNESTNPSISEPSKIELLTYSQPTQPSANIEMCKIKERNENRIRWADSQLPTGFPGFTHATKMGTVKWALIPLDFSDLPGESSYRSRVDGQMLSLSEWFMTVSSGKFNVEWVVHDKWVRLPGQSSDYQMDRSDNMDRVPNGIKFWTDAMTESDKVFDFTGIQTVNFILPSGQTFIRETSQGFPWDSAVRNFKTNEGSVYSYSAAGRFMDQPGRQYWSYWAHEFGHAMALPHIGSSRDPNPFLGLDLMSSQDGESRELSGWMRFVAGWLDDDKVYCQPSSSLDRTEVSLIPISNSEVGLKMVVIPVSKTKAVVIESRRETKFSCTMPSKRNGVLVYTYDATLSHGENFLKPVTPGDRRAEGSSTCPVYPYPNPILYKGDKIVTDGLMVQVTDSLNLDKIVISRTS